MRGISNRDILKYTQQAASSVIKYQADRQNLDILKTNREIVAERKIGSKLTASKQANTLRRIDNQISRLENEIALNPSTKLVESGLMPSIVDDLEMANIQSPYASDVENLAVEQLNKLPTVVKNVGKTAFMTDDTTGYKLLNNAVKMTDYVGRYVLYQEYTKKRGKSHDDAVSAVVEEFINFDLPTHRIIEYSNQIGLFWFSKYQLRILKQIKNSVTDRPFEAMVNFLLAAKLGISNIGMSVPGITKDATQLFGEPISALYDSGDEILAIDLASEIVN